MADEPTPPVAEPPAGYIAETEVKEKYVLAAKHNAEMAKLRKQSEGRKTTEELLADDAFRTQALEAWNVKPDGKPAKPTGDDVEKLHKDWEQKHLRPVKEEMTKQSSEVARLRERDLHGQIIGAAASVVKDSLLQSPVPSNPPPIVHLLAPYFGWSDEAKDWCVKEGDGFAFGANPSKERPYKTVAEFMADWAKDKTNTDWIKDMRQRGAAFQQPGKGLSSDFQNLSPTERLKRARAQSL